MALSLTYNTLQEQLRNAKPIEGSDTGGTLAGTVVINVPQLQPVNVPMTDFRFASGVTATQRKQDEGLTDLGLKRVGTAKIINDSSTPTYLVNADRVVINSKQDYAMLLGKAGVAIASPGKVNVDSDDSITLFGLNNVYLGLPNRGEASQGPNPKQPQNKTSTGKILKSSPTTDFAYEPLVLGLKLTNWLEDLLQVLKNAVLLTPVGRGYFREDTQYDLAGLQARLKEMLSTYAFIDGYSHELVDSVAAPPSTITEPPTSITGEVTGVVTPDTGVTGASTAVSDSLATLPDYYTSTDLNIQYK